jgi:universal stress protein E
MSSQPFRKILVCIEFPGERDQPVLKRAAGIAQHTGAKLTLFHSDLAQLTVVPGFPSAVVREDANAKLARSREALQKLAAPLRRRGLKVELKCAWDAPPHEAIVREVLRSKPDLVVAGSRRRAFGARLFLTNTDWQLIRECPVPLLFVKQNKPWRSVRVMAAIDPLHPRGGSSRLDRRILDIAGSFSEALGGRLDVVHAYLPLSSSLPYAIGDAYAPVVDAATEQRHRATTERALARTTRAAGIPPARQHIETGFPQEALPAAARRLRADVVVMGAISRGALGRLLIGSTAERTLDLLPCDVLVVKPRGFKTRVSRRPS